jgi:hypothetical protein
MYYKGKKEKEKKKKIPICQECMTSSEERWFYFIEAEKIREFTSIPHQILICDKCLKENNLNVKDTAAPYDKRRKEKIDTSNWIEDKPTYKGNKRFIFIKKDGTETILVAESGLKKGYKPKLKK